MTEVFLQTLTALLGRTGLTVYAAGCVPDGVPLPLLIYDWQCSQDGRGVCTLQAWFDADRGNTARAAWLALLEEIVPPQGVVCRAGEGFLWLKQRSQQLTQDRDALGVKVSLATVAVM